MKRALRVLLLAAAAAPAAPALAAQNPELVGSFRPYLYVLLAFAAGWLVVGAWVLRIGSRVNRLARRIEEERGEG